MEPTSELSTWAPSEEEDDDDTARRALDYPSAAAMSWAAGVKAPGASGGAGGRGTAASPLQPRPLPADAWDPLWRRPARRGAAARRAPAWRRPPWLPEWADPVDPASDMRRWLLPYLALPYAAVQLLKALVVGPALAAQLASALGGAGPAGAAGLPPGGAFSLRPEQVERCEQAAERYRAHLEFERLVRGAPGVAAGGGGGEREAREAEAAAAGGDLAAVRSKLAADERAAAEDNCRGLTDLASDGAFAALVGAKVALNARRATSLQTTLAREFFALDSSRQAFILLLISDILVARARWDCMVPHLPGR